MKVNIEPFDAYFLAARDVETELLDGTFPLIDGLRRYHEFFTASVFSERNPLSPIQGLLAVNGFMIYLSSIRVAMSGHGAAMFPLLRVALEASCYAFQVGEKDELEEIWLNRNSSAEALSLCRTKFHSAVRDAAKGIQRKSWAGGNTEAWINQAYDAAIDFGAHPNPKGLWPYARLNKNYPDGYHHVALAAVYGAGSFETSRCLLACLDYGLLIALILSSCCDVPCEDAMVALNDLNELKEKLTKECFPNEMLA